MTDIIYSDSKYPALAENVVKIVTCTWKRAVRAALLDRDPETLRPQVLKQELTQTKAGA